MVKEIAGMGLEENVSEVEMLSCKFLLSVSISVVLFLTVSRFETSKWSVLKILN